MLRPPDTIRDVGFDVIELEKTDTDSTGREQSGILRLLDVTDLNTLIQEAIGLAHWYAEDGPMESREYFEFCLEMLPFIGVSSAVDPMHERRFNAKTLDHAPVFSEMLEMTRATRLSQAERLKRIVTAEHPFDRSSFEAARYENPDILLPLDRVRYENFRDGLLEEMGDVRAELERSADKTVRNQAREWLADPDESQEQKTKAQKILDADDVFTICPELYDAWDEIEQMLMKSALQIESDRTRPFESLIDPVSEILAEVTAKARGTDSSPELRVEIRYKQLDEFLPISRSVELVRRIIEIEERHPDSMGALAKSLMHEAIETRKPDDLWEALAWFRENMVNRNECIRLLCRESEQIINYLLEIALQERYVKIRSELSVAERRLYRFMYRRSDWFNERIPAFDPIAEGYLFGLDDEHASLVVSAIAFRGDQQQIDEMADRWKSFISLYPFWIELIRSSEAECKARKRSSPWTDEIEENLGSDDPRKRRELRLPRSLVDASIQSVQMLVDRHCSQKQSEVILAEFVDQRSQAEIAEELGISQQAVSQRIQSGLERIRAGLFTDDAVETITSIERST